MPNIGNIVTYTASYAPGNATLPVTYLWSITPSTAGSISPNNTASAIDVQWNEIGNHSLVLTTQNCGGTQTYSTVINVTAVPSYNPCSNNITWNATNVTCNGNGSSTIVISVSGNNSEIVEFSLNTDPFVTANVGTNGFSYTFDSNGNSYGVSSRIVGCSTVITEIITACTPQAPPTTPVAPSTPVATPVTPGTPVAPTTMYYLISRCTDGHQERAEMTFTGLDSGTVIKLTNGECYTIIGTSTVFTTNTIASVESSCNSCLGITPATPVTPVTPEACIGIYSGSINGENNVTSGSTYTYTSTLLPSNATTPITYSWSLANSAHGTINGSNTGSSINVTWTTTQANTSGVNLLWSNCAGSSGIALPITISNSTPPSTPTTPVTPEACVAISSGSISGDNVVNGGDTRTYTSNLLPINATTPITYSWNLANPIHGTINGSDSSSTVNITWSESATNSSAVNLVWSNCGSQNGTSFPVSITLYTPPTPVLSVCKVSSDANFTAAGFGNADTVKLYSHPSNTFIGNMTINAGLATFTITSFVNEEQYYCTASKNVNTSGASNVVVTNLSMANC